eukprot:TRINITY_DN14484_c0_g2_i1.p2 TRINITY_DN14484_c0_g2~~TRINITY_DN14484_c0_g2_i1.p2  ORF type:complete len:184 (+),score=26.75 TRINITY_DN14484_c0_g2_i1:155-706(+)
MVSMEVRGCSRGSPPITPLTGARELGLARCITGALPTVIDSPLSACWKTLGLSDAAPWLSLWARVERTLGPGKEPVGCRLVQVKGRLTGVDGAVLPTSILGGAGWALGALWKDLKRVGVVAGRGTAQSLTGWRVPEVRGRWSMYLTAKSLGSSSAPSPHGPTCLLYTSPSPRDRTRSRMPSSA